MAAVKPSIRHMGKCFRCVRSSTNANSYLNGTATRLFSTSSSLDQTQLQGKPNSSNGPPLNPETAWRKKDEQSLLEKGTLPIGSRRRRAALKSKDNAGSIPFEQLPYQCFQEARKILREDREEKIKQIETQKLRLNNLLAQDPEVSGGVQQKEARIRSMRNYINQLIVLADINDPLVKKRFEDGEGDMNKPIYRYLADQKWRKYKRLILEQRIDQFKIVPDFLPALNATADVDLAFGRRKINPGEFVQTVLSENVPKLRVQTFEPGEKLVTVLVVNGDVPLPATDEFTTYCHFAACNIPISPTQTSISLSRLGIFADRTKVENAPTTEGSIVPQDGEISISKAAESTSTKETEPASLKEDESSASKETEPTTKVAGAATPAEGKTHVGQVVKPWHKPYSLKGAPYQRQVVFVLEQAGEQPANLWRIQKTKRTGFNVRSFVDTHQMKPIGVSLFRTQWDENTPKLLASIGREDQINVEFKRKRVEPLPYKRRTERMR